MTTPKISLTQLRRLIREEAVALTEEVDHKSINSVVGVASKLLAAVESFKEKAPPAAINAVTPHLSQLEKVLENMVSSPGSYVPRPKKEPQKVTLKAVKGEAVEHGDRCPECGGMIISKHGQYEHLKCRDCGYVPSDD